MAPPDDKASGMLALPTEVQQNIIDESGNIKSTRLVCHELAAASDRAFLEKYFTDRRHIITECGLRGLINISGDARLRSKLQGIELVIPELCEYTFPRSEPLQRVSLSPFEPVTSDGIGAVVLRSRVKTLAKLCKEQRDTQQRDAVWNKWDSIMPPFRQSGQDLRLLTEAFSNLARAGVHVRLELAADLDGQPFGLRQLEQQLNASVFHRHTRTAWSGKPRFGTCKDYTGTANTLFKAVAEARCPLSGLRLEGNGEYAVVDFSAFVIPKAIDTGFQHALSFLKKLELSFGMGTIQGGFSQVGSEDFDHFMRATSSLERLMLDFNDLDGEMPHGFLSSVFRAFAMGGLKSIRLGGGISCATEELRSFLNHHRSTLKSLGLNSITLAEDYAWSGFLRELAISFQLEHFDLTTVAHGRYRLDVDKDDCMFSHGSVEVVSEALLRFVATSACCDSEWEDEDD